MGNDLSGPWHSGVWHVDKPEGEETLISFSPHDHGEPSPIHKFRLYPWLLVSFIHAWVQELETNVLWILILCALDVNLISIYLSIYQRLYTWEIEDTYCSSHELRTRCYYYWDTAIVGCAKGVRWNGLNDRFCKTISHRKVHFSMHWPVLHAALYASDPMHRPIAQSCKIIPRPQPRF